MQVPQVTLVEAVKVNQVIVKLARVGSKVTGVKAIHCFFGLQETLKLDIQLIDLIQTGLEFAFIVHASFY